jgi:hypothetical protein
MTSKTRVWALWSARVEMYSEPELVALFATEAVAHAVRDGLIGKPREPNSRLYGVWVDDEDFPDLYVRPVEIH